MRQAALIETVIIDTPGYCFQVNKLFPETFGVFFRGEIQDKLRAIKPSGYSL
jgi:hypothetical protein